jgi:hypothetical protein
MVNVFPKCAKSDIANFQPFNNPSLVNGVPSSGAFLKYS